MQHNLIILNDEFQKTEIYKDIGNYKNMTLLALSKKLPYWENIYKKANGNYNYIKKKHLKNYCRDCDADVMFLVQKSDQSNVHRQYTMYTTSKDEFWDFYREQFRILYQAAFYHFNDTKIANEEVQCFCGGHYQATNKGKHYKTKKHLKYQTVSDCIRQY